MEFTRYLRKIERYPVLDRAAELELARAAAGGDLQAREELIQAHLRDVVAIARRYRGYGCDLAELVAIGTVGLLRGVDDFDPERGLRLMTYAGYWVRAEILAHIVSGWSMVELGSSSLQTRLFFGLRRQRARMQALHGENGEDGEPGDDGEGSALVQALARHFDCKAKHIVAMLQRLDGRDLSLDGVFDLGASDDLEARVIAEELQALVRRRLRGTLPRLDERQQLIVRRRFLEDNAPSLVELGRELRLSRERVRQLEQQACTILRRSMLDLHVDGY
ncbi:MAG: sigma-70 family RNA polymerase sigma factor [Myxococcales bacterium]|nr:sigma-70 family RNA polymerase sigma factor [Myxococcales bacterium]